MTHALGIIAGAGPIHTSFEWGRIQSNADWIPPAIACILILLLVRYWYRKDSVELHPVAGWLLTLLRAAVFLGLLILYLQPQWRSQREETRNSRALLLIDTSQSMGIADEAQLPSAMPDNGARPPSAVAVSSRPVTAGLHNQPGAAGLQAESTRSKQIVDALEKTDFLAALRRTHDVAVFPFAEELKRPVELPAMRNGTQPPSAEANDPSRPGAAGLQAAGQPDWSRLLEPTGAETRLGQALRQLIQDERGGPISGVIVFSDGGQNAGLSPDAAVELAREAKIPVFTVGLGADRLPANVSVSDFSVPARAYPGDRYAVTGYVRASGLAGKTVEVELLSRPASEAADSAAAGEGKVLESRKITLGDDGETVPVKIELMPEGVGRRTLRFRVRAPESDRFPADDFREADVEIVDRKNRVLLAAGGPSREYQFLRNMLFRDRSSTVDVLLQSGRPGISQEANQILDEFPATREALYPYDCVVALDPDWKRIGPERAALLEKWVGEQGGGLIVVAGAVHAGRGLDGWPQDPALAAIRNLYPVEFPGRLAALADNVYAGRKPWPPAFTREGREADFLRLADSSAAAQKIWDDFPGVYGFCPVRGPKPGATVYAAFSDPEAARGGLQPVYFAGQFYGSGIVFYLGSGEMWRLRALDPAYFDQFYTKLIRHVSQGRLLRGSTRGTLLTGQDRYLLGNVVEVRAQLNDARLEPLDRPEVDLRVVAPDNSAQTVVLQPDPGRAGSYMGRFAARQEGTYRLELAVPESEGEKLSRRIQVMSPDLERENPRRNDALLSAMAQETGGRYYVGLKDALDPGDSSPLAVQLQDRTSTIILPVAPNPIREERWLRGLMIALCGLLCIEWLLRRLLKLA